MIKFRIISPLELNFNFRILCHEEFTNGCLVCELFLVVLSLHGYFFLKCLYHYSAHKKRGVPSIITKGGSHYDINHTPFVSWQSRESKAM